MRRALFLLPLIVSTACLSPEGYERKQAKLFCNALHDCQKGTFESNYTSMSDCVETNSRNAEDNYSTCEFDRKEAKECLNASRALKGECNPTIADLTELGRACNDVYFSCGVVNSGLGLSQEEANSPR